MLLYEHRNEIKKKTSVVMYKKKNKKTMYSKDICIQM